jgi:hypothetical protein
VVVRASSDNVEFPDATGFGVVGALEFESWQLRLAYLRYSDDTDKSGVVCQVYSPRIGCRTEGVSTSARMGGLRFVVLRTLGLADRIEVGAGGGVSFNTLSATSQGESGFRADLHLPNTGQIGYVAAASLGFRPSAALPFEITAGWSGHWVKFRGCVDPTDPTSGYAPFCGWDRFTEIQVGAMVALPAR